MDTPQLRVVERLRQQLNAEGQADAEQKAAVIRDGVIKFAVHAVKEFLDEVDRAQDEAMEESELPEDGLYRIYVFNHTFSSAPFELGEPMSTRSILFARDSSTGQKGKDHLRIHVPSDESGNPVEDTNRIFYERIAEDGTVSAFCITRDMFYQFTPGLRAFDGKDQLGGEFDFEAFGLRSNTHIVEMGELYDDLMNMHIVPQEVMSIADILAQQDTPD